MPLIARIGGSAGSYKMSAEAAFTVAWRLRDGGALRLSANLGDVAAPLVQARGAILFAHGPVPDFASGAATLAPGAVVLTLEEGTDFMPLPI
jgi:hypothetical protein